MRKRSPQNLVDCSLKELVDITLETLQRFETRNNLRETIFIEDCTKMPLSRKRKLDHETKTFDQQPNKRLRRKSHDFAESEFQKSFPNKKLISKDDYFIQDCSLVDAVIILKNYFKYMPQNLWNIFFCSVLKGLNNLEPNSTVEVKAIEFLFSKNVSSFSTKLICHDFYDKCEQLLYERICLCKNLKSLDIHYNVQINYINIFLSSLCKLTNLRHIMLLPETKQSFHKAIPIIAKQCKHLEELTIVYDSELLSEIGNISFLIVNKKLKNLTLYSYGKGSETKYILQLLYNLGELRYFYHRELPHALIDISLKLNETQNIYKLKSLLLATYCKCVGSHLCYLPDESLRRIGLICPFISHLTIIKPSNLSDIVESLPSLVKLQVHDCNIKEALITCLERKSLNCLEALSLINIETIDHGCISLISNCCPHLKELEIIHSNLFSSNDLKFTKIAFPQLRKLKILKFSCFEQIEPRFVYPHTMIIDKNLFKYLLSGAINLEQLYLEFDSETVQFRENNSIPSEEELISYISTHNELKDLMLLSCSSVSYKMINSIVSSCPKLRHLWDMDLWKIPSIEMDKIVRYYSHLFFQSYERSR